MKQTYLLTVLFLSALYGMFILYQPFLLTIIIAILLSVSTASVAHKIANITSSNLVSSIIATLLLSALFFAPLGYFLTALTIKLNTLDPQTFQIMLLKITTYIKELPEIFNPIKSLFDNIHVEKDLPEYALSITKAVGSYSGNFLKNSFLIIIFYFFVQYNGKSMLRFLERVIQLPQVSITQLGFEISSVMSVVFYSLIATAMLEGALFGFAISYMGYDGILYGIMYGFASFIPVIGGAIMWIPFALYEYTQGNESAAIFITLYSIIVISVFADTLVKPLIIKYISTHLLRTKVNLNEIVIFFSIIAGLATFGFWGMILGPAITSFFFALLKLIEDVQKNRH